MAVTAGAAIGRLNGAEPDMPSGNVYAEKWSGPLINRPLLHYFGKAVLGLLVEGITLPWAWALGVIAS